MRKPSHSMLYPWLSLRWDVEGAGPWPVGLFGFPVLSRFWIWAVLLCLGAWTAASGFAEILEGQVAEDHSGEPLASARVRIRPAGNLYLEDITYGGRSVLHKPFRLGSAMAGAELWVIVDHDGGFLETRVADGDGEPVTDAEVIIIPKEATTLHALAATRITGRTDQNGEYTSPPLAPGAYYVLAAEASLSDLAPETISKLFNARSKAKEVEVPPNKTVQVTLEPTVLD
jgi:hypothetical protein